jgi:dTDP-glucose 4,6-dehydratase
VISAVVAQDLERIVKEVGEGVHRLSDRDLLLTGGTGFVGTYLLGTLLALNDGVLAKPCRVHAVTRNPERVRARFPHIARRRDLVLLGGDVRTVALPSIPWTFIIHAAGPSDARLFATDPLGTADTIVEGTRAVLSVAAAVPVEAVLFVSSGAIYGTQPPDHLWLAEDHPGGPDLTTVRSCYAEAKRYAETLCRIFLEQHRVPVSVGRLFALVGPYQELNSTSAVIDFIRQALEGDTIRIKDDGHTVRSYCYIADAVIGLWKVLLRRQAGGVFNIGSDLEAVSFIELAQRIGRCLGKPVKVFAEGAPASGILGGRYCPDVTRLAQEEGYRPSTSLDEALRRTIAWMREQQADASVPR